VIGQHFLGERQRMPQHGAGLTQALTAKPLVSSAFFPRQRHRLLVLLQIAPRLTLAETMGSSAKNSPIAREPRRCK
jgi:hypothetical protein